MVLLGVVPLLITPTPLLGSASDLPDLTIKRFWWTPRRPRVGDHVRFHVIVENIGNVPTQEGQVCGVAFSIGSGNPMFWSDKYRHSIKPGEQVVLTDNGGASGRDYWVATTNTTPAGVYAIVNDARRFPESNWLNNVVVHPMRVSGSGATPEARHQHLPDLVVTDFTWWPRHPKFPQAIKARFTVRNQGTVATPADKPIGVGIYTNYLDTAVLYGNRKLSLGPGKSITLFSSGGTHGYPWIAFPGKHLLTAKVNDVGAIKESDTENNYLSKTIRVRDPREEHLRRLKLTLRQLRGRVFGDQSPAEPPWTARENVFDGSEDTGGISSSPVAVRYGVDLGSRTSPVKEIAFYGKPYYESRLKGGLFQGSNAPDSGYETIASIRTVPPMGWNFLEVHNPKRFRFLRYLSPANTGGMMHEIVFFGPRHG